MFCPPSVGRSVAYSFMYPMVASLTPHDFTFLQNNMFAVMPFRAKLFWSSLNMSVTLGVKWSAVCRLRLTTAKRVSSGVTTRGEVRQLPQGAKRQGALLVNGLFALHYRIQPNF